MIRPAALDTMLFLPERAYMILGALRAQSSSAPRRTMPSVNQPSGTCWNRCVWLIYLNG